MTGSTGAHVLHQPHLPIDAQELLSHSGVQAAGRRLEGLIRHTPTVRSDDLDRSSGARLWLKAENLQRGGSFKIRGALLAVERLAASGSRGLVAQSTGNHAISVALAARDHGLPAVLVLPCNAAPMKIRRIQDAGAEVILAGTVLAERMTIVDELRAERGLDVVDPYQDPYVVTGQGTATAELLDQVDAAGGRLDSVVLPVGGGSAVAGACLATAGPDGRRTVAVIAAEPAAVPALTQAMRSGHPVTVPVGTTIADGLRPDRIGQLPFDLAHGTVADVLMIEESEIAEAMCLALTHARLLVEPAAATALAAALRLGRADDEIHDIGVVLTGGNVEAELVARTLAEHAGRPTFPLT